MKPTPSFVALAVLLPLAVASCQGSSPDPLTPYKDQVVAWVACDGSFLPADQVELASSFGARMRCARIRAPLDHADPSRGDIEVAVSRIAAADPARRVRATLSNPGGPGGDGIAPFLAKWRTWADASLASPTGRLYREYMDTHDIVGFSPRGVGASTPLDCAPAVPQSFTVDPSRDVSDANVATMLANARALTDSCRTAPLRTFVNTDATARDMDLIRHLLGDGKIDYVGVSYGTWLGNWYASLFPDRVGRMLLSGVMDFTRPLDEMRVAISRGRQRVVDEVLLPYAARHPDRFLLGADPAAIRSLLESMSAEVHGALVVALMSLEEGNIIIGSPLADHCVLAIRVAQRLGEEVAANPSVDEETLKQAMASATFVPRGDLDAIAHATAARMVEIFFRLQRRQPLPVAMSGWNAVHWAVQCNDTASAFTEASWVEQLRDVARRYPEGVGDPFAMQRNLCLTWGGPSVTRPPQEGATRVGGILMLETQLDPQTPWEGARRSLALLPSASYLEITGEYTHGIVPPYGTECVDRAVGQYLLDGVLPPRETLCPGLPLAADAGM